MAKVYKVTFKRVNGDKTGYYTRRGTSKNYPSDGIHYMKNCVDGKTFYCETTPGTNGYYTLRNPESNGIKTNGNPCYAWLHTSFCSWVLVDDPDEKKVTPPAPVTPAPTPAQNPVQLKPKPQAQTLNTSLLSGTSENVWSTGVGVETSKKLDSAILDTQANTDAIRNQMYKNEGDSIGNDLPSLTKINRTTFYNDYSGYESNFSIMRKNLNINDSASDLAVIRNNMIERFNRWKVAYPDTQLTKTFAHVFFTRPNLNLYKTQGSKIVELNSQAANDPVYYYLDKNNRALLLTLTKAFSGKHDFNPFLSNMARSFELSDESIESIEHGETFTGYKVKYGRHNIKSKTAGQFSISYIDDDDYRVYKLHKAWADYISKVYRGEFEAMDDYRRWRILDYACSVYYFLCGADGETILFWSKYTGVYPLNIPSAASSWTAGNLIKMPEVSIQYDYAWKEDFNPTSLAEFNINGQGAQQSGQLQYISTYERELLTTGKTFTGSPFIESTHKKSGDYVFKLKFRYPGDNN